MGHDTTSRGVVWQQCRARPGGQQHPESEADHFEEKESWVGRGNVLFQVELWSFFDDDVFYFKFVIKRPI
jgi:hypothetical protein